MLVLGVDPSLQTTGYGIVSAQAGGLRYVAGGIIAPHAGAALSTRLAHLQQELTRVIASHRPQSMIIEEVFSRSAYPKTAILMAHARGALLCAAALHGMPVHEYTATSVKSALVGRGGASKEQVAAMVAQVLSLGLVPSPPDITDALALAIAFCWRKQAAKALGRAMPGYAAR